MAWTKSVFSSMIDEISYDETRKVMAVKFSKGGLYEYEGVSEDVAAALASAPSVGQMFLSDIRNSYTAKRIR